MKHHGWAGNDMRRRVVIALAVGLLLVVLCLAVARRLPEPATTQEDPVLMRFPIPAAATISTGFFAPYAELEECTRYALACADGPSLLALIDGLHAGPESNNNRMMRYPGLRDVLAAEPMPVRYVCHQDYEALELEHLSSRHLLEILASHHVAPVTLMEFGEWQAVALPPSMDCAEPLLAWHEDRVVIASNTSAAPDCFRSRALSAAVEAAAVLSLREYGKVVHLPVAMRAVPSPELELLPPQDARPAQGLREWVESTLKQAEPEDNASPELWPHEVFVLAGSGDALATADLLPSAFGGSPEAGKYFGPGGISAAPLVTESAWCLLTMGRLYSTTSADVGAALIDDRKEDLQAWGDFLTRWRRGPDPAPLSTLEEQAGPGDLYPVLLVYLGLSAAKAMWPAGETPAAWQARLEELQVELSARLLQEGQCLSCPEHLHPLLQEARGLSAIVISALEALPVCPPNAAPSAVLPDCEFPEVKTAL